MLRRPAGNGGAPSFSMPEQTDEIDHGLTLDGLKSIVAPIARRYGVTQVHLFGSRSRGDYHEDSDFDLLITVRKGAGLLDLGCFVYDLEEALEKPVGISFRDSATEMFLEAIAPDLKEVYVQEQDPAADPAEHRPSPPCRSR